MFAEFTLLSIFLGAFFFSLVCWGGTGMELLLMKFDCYLISLVFDFSPLFIIYSFVVFFVFVTVFSFTLLYFDGSLSLDFLFFFTLFFISMEMLIFSGNFFSMIIFWDLLGFTSYYLVSFYFSKESLDSGLVTFVFNRLGDSMIILSMGYYFFFSENFSCLGFFSLDFFCFLLLMGFFTSSCQFPFSSWLPLAMAAPTPVSSLVHSSTLVTAGIVMIMKLDFLFLSSVSIFLISMLGLLTVLVGGAMSYGSLDLSSIIAFSTLSQMGLICLSYGFGGMEVCLFHMIVHAFFKSTLFILLGSLMVNFYLTQDVRIFSHSYNFLGINNFLMMFSVSNLVGLPLCTGWVTKDLIIESFEGSFFSFIYFFIFLFGCCFTGFYSFSIFFFLSGLGLNFFPKSGLTFFSFSHSYTFMLGGGVFLIFFLFLMGDFFINFLVVGGLSNLLNSSIIFFMLFLYNFMKSFIVLFSFGLGFNFLFLGVLMVFGNWGIFLKDFMYFFSSSFSDFKIYDSFWSESIFSFNFLVLFIFVFFLLI